MIKRLLQANIRQRLLVLALLPVLLIIPIVVAMAYWWTSQVDYRQLLMKANTDLTVAQETLINTRQNYLMQLALSAESLNLRQQLAPDLSVAARERLADQLEQLRIETGLDYIRLLSPRGCDWLRRQDCSYPYSSLITEALDGWPQSGLELFSARQLARLDTQLARRAELPLIATEYAQPTARRQEDRGMILHVVYPLQNSQRQTQALVVGGLLMNGNITFVDRIRSTVYGPGSLLPGSLGTVTLFLDDVRISTNVPDRQNTELRALGTRVSAEVRQQVLEQGEVWLDRAYVVSDWYVSGYAPITDVDNNRIGMLYSGFLEAPYKAEFYRWVRWLLVFFAVMLVLSGIWAVLNARSIFRPLEAMALVISRIRQGQRIRMDEQLETHELQVLAQEFNQMLAQVELQHDQIQRAAEQLELKVEERTEELRQHIQLLQNTREQLVAKGKLAAIGELTAGIAHEINNPTAVILGYLDLMMAELGEAGTPVQSEAQLIIEQVERIRSIINNLLQYSRPDDFHTELGPVDINRIIADTLPLVKHDLARHQITLKLDLRATRDAVGQRQQLQQVLINLMVNANNAMPDGGKLTLRSRNWRDNGVLLVVADNGCGMDAETLSHIFAPFYSKTQGGTGLGLAVTQTLLQRLRAEIAVRSRPGVGTRFYIWLQPARKPLGQTVSIGSR